MPGEEDQLEKHQIVVHLTLQEYQVRVATFLLLVVKCREFFHFGIRQLQIPGYILTFCCLTFLIVVEGRCKNRKGVRLM